MKFSRKWKPNIKPSPIAISLYPEKSKYICRVNSIGFNHAARTLSATKNAANSPRTFASNTFLDKPITKRFTPSENVLYVVFLLDSSFSTVEYLTIGPAINCGNRAIYVHNFIILF
mgnify:CR=1 FL=1